MPVSRFTKVRRWRRGQVALLAALLTSGVQASAQQGASAAGIGSSVSATSTRGSTNASEPSTAAFFRRPVIPGLQPIPGTTRKTEDDVTEAEREDKDRIASPPAGTPIGNLMQPNIQFGERLDRSVVQQGGAGKRLAGSNAPSPEALTYDPRDQVESRQIQLSDPREPR